MFDKACTFIVCCFMDAKEWFNRFALWICESTIRSVVREVISQRYTSTQLLHLNVIVEHVISNSWARTCCCNNLHISPSVWKICSDLTRRASVTSDKVWLAFVRSVSPCLWFLVLKKWLSKLLLSNTDFCFTVATNKDFKGQVLFFDLYWKHVLLYCCSYCYRAKYKQPDL